MRRHSGFRAWFRRRRSTLSLRSKHSDHSTDLFHDEDVCSMNGSLTPDSLNTGPIEKGSKDGQGQYAEDLVKALKAGVSSGSRARAGSKGKKGRKGKKGDAQLGGDSNPVEAKGKQKKKVEDWGLLEPLRPLFGPAIEPIKPLFSARSMCVLLLFLLTVSWFRNSRIRASTRQNTLATGGHPLNSPAGYDHIWRNEEEALWKWLEQRIAMKDGIPVVDGGKANADMSKEGRRAKQQVLRGRGDPESMSVREIEYALRVTKEKLGRLERAVEVHNGHAETPDTAAA